MASEESLVFKITGVDGATAVFKRVEKSIGDLKGAYTGLIGAAATLGVGAFVKDAVEWQESLVRLGEIAGTTAEKFSSFALPAKLAGTSLDAVATSVARLSRSIGEARLGDVGKSSLLQALGIDPADSRDAADIMVDVAKALAGMKDQTVAAKISQDLLGRSFAELRPLMQEIAKQGTLNAAASEEQIERAKELSDNLIKLQFSAKQASLALTEDLVIGLTRTTDAMIKARQESGILAAAVAGIQTLFTGDDQHKNDVETVELLDRQLEIQNELAKLSKLGMQDGARYAELTKALAGVNAQLQTTLAYRKQLEGAGGGGDVGAGLSDELRDEFFGKLFGVSAEDLVRQRIKFEKEYPALIQALETGAKNYATAVKVADAYLAETRKLGLITEEEFIAQRAANQNLLLEKENDFLRQEIDLAKKKGDVERRATAERRIAQNEAQRVANDAIAQAQISSARAQKASADRAAGGKAFSDTDAFIDDLAFKRDVEERWYQDRLSALSAFESLGGEEAEKAAAARERLAMVHRDRLVAIAEDEWQHRVLFAKFTNRDLMTLNTSLFGTLSELMQSHSHRMFQVGKAAAIANTIITTYEAAQKSYSSLAGIPIIGPALGAAAAAAAIIVGLQRVQAIRSTEFGGGGGASPTYNAAPGTSVPAAPVGSPSSVSAGSQLVVHVEVTGAVVGTMSDLARALGDELKDLIDTQDMTIIGPNSRQASVITSGV